MAAASGSIGARLLIMIYGAAIVAIGAYPIKQEYGSVEEFFKREMPGWFSKESLEKLRVQRPEETEDKKTARARLETPRIVTEDKAAQEDLDTIEKNDRKQLSDLLNFLK